MFKREVIRRKTCRTMDIDKANVFNYIEFFRNSHVWRKAAKIDCKISDFLELSLQMG
ncbi:IS3 family transposase [Pectobacterium aroidearum]|uniref:IS3 family transposase n=1 Tax=Pectobacterium aroidearum TaxID=1201031 RepID=A0ABR5ZHX7_9GAMM|nr:IS3 family transposase [Pectobacterium aroidearum]MBA5234119.1 IS3 family transposase [Pectobacterium aroidearum]MBA5739311.1 IS3 family transposase [Pectobacterium aroidearum]